MISRFFTQTVSVQRMALQDDNESTGLVTVGNILAQVQQARIEFAQQIGEAWGKTFMLWCALGTDVQSGDKITITGGSFGGTYSLSEIQTNVIGHNSHLQCVLIKDV